MLIHYHLEVLYLCHSQIYKPPGIDFMCGGDIEVRLYIFPYKYPNDLVLFIIRIFLLFYILTFSSIHCLYTPKIVSELFILVCWSVSHQSVFCCYNKIIEARYLTVEKRLLRSFLGIQKHPFSFCDGTLGWMAKWWRKRNKSSETWKIAWIVLI